MSSDLIGGAIQQHLDTRVEDPLVGRLLGPYQLTRRLGAGGMGAVYEARQTEPERLVAVKVIHAWRESDSAKSRFKYEASALARLQHPGVAQIFASDTADSGHGHVPYIAMELVRGEPLTEYVQTHTCDQRERLRLFIAICEAVQHAHQQGVTHRDLKPANVLVADGQPKVVDFGVARLTAEYQTNARVGTQTGELLGTLTYMSPEQAAGETDAIDTRCDVYSLGVILYELLSDLQPFDFHGQSLGAVILKIRDEEPEALGRVDARLRGDLEAITARAMAKEKSQRYASAEALAADVERFLVGEPVTAQPDRFLYRARKFLGRNRTLVGGVAATLLALAVGLIGILVSDARTRAAAAEAQEERYRAALAAHDEAVAAARVARYQGDWETVLARHQDALVERDSSEARLGVVEALVNLGRVQASREACDQYLTSSPTGEGLYWSGRVALLEEDQDEADELFEAALSTELPLAMRSHAEAMLAESLADFVEKLDQAVWRNPTDPTMRAELAMGYFLAGRIEETRDQLDALTTLGFADRGTILLRALVLTLSGEHDEALRGIETAGEREPDLDVGFYIDIVRLAAHAPKSQEMSSLASGAILTRAEKILQDLQQDRGSLQLPRFMRESTAPILSATSALLFRNDERAVEAFERSVELLPNPLLRYLHSVALCRVNRCEEAAEVAWEVANETEMPWLRTRCLIAGVRDLTWVERSARVHAFYVRFLNEIKPIDIIAGRDAYDMGWIACSVDDHRAALRFLRRAVDLGHDTDDMDYWLGVAHDELGEADLANLYLTRFLEDTDPANEQLQGSIRDARARLE